MKKLLVIILTLLLSILAYCQESATKPKISDSSDYNKHTHNNVSDRVTKEDIIAIKENSEKIIKTIDEINDNTQPQSFVGKLFEGWFFQWTYDLFFGGSEKPGLIPFIISIVGIILSLIRIIWYISRFRKTKTVTSTSFYHGINTILLFLVSFLLLIVSNDNFQSAEISKLKEINNSIKELESKIEDIKGMLIQPPGHSVDYTNKLYKEQFEKLISLNRQILKSTENCKKETIKSIENKKSYGVLIGLIFIGVLYIIFVFHKNDLKDFL